MKILITGGAGFIGSHTAEYLQFTGGHEVAVLDNLSTGRKENLDPQIRLFEGDVENARDFVSLDAVFRPDVVVHLAAQPAISTSWRNPLSDARVNIIGTLQALNIAKILDVKKFVFASTSAVYREKETVMFEDDPTGPSSPYGISKLAAEGYVRLFPRHAILRFGNVYGPRQVPLGENQVIPRMIRHFEKGDKFFIHGDGEQVRDFVFVRDVARAIEAALNTEKSGTYNIASGTGVSVNTLAKMLEQIYGAEGYLWQHSPTQDPRRYAVLGVKNARKDLNWKTKMSLADGLIETIGWWSKK
jgi:UDP-glucose 4-epimerase